MREIWFKAKRIDNGEWVEGYYVMFSTSITHPYSHTNGEHNIITVPHNERYKIDPETLCQDTGLTDKNGRKIWENDIVYIPYENLGDSTCRVVFKRGAFIGELYDGCEDSICYTNKEFVIGNIFDNPELLRKESEE